MLDTHTVYRDQPDDPPAPRPVILTSPPLQKTTPKPIVKPINRRMIDWFTPIFWFVLAALAFALTTYSTATQTGTIIDIMKIAISPASKLAIGAVVALLITLGEVVTSERRLYFVFLIPDVAFTLWWSWPGLYNASTAIGAGAIGAAVVGIALGVVSAWLPERVVFGNRRKA